jgi:transposase
MPRSVTARRPTRRELRRLHDLLEREPGVRQRRRAQAIVVHAAGLEVSAIAEALGAHRNTIAADLHAFDARGLACLTTLRSGGAPSRLSAEARATMLDLADRSPAEVGLPYGRWSLAKLRAYLLAHRVVRAISREHLRRVLQRGGSASDTSSASCAARTHSAARS